MAHELDINTAADGTQVTSFASARVPAWHRLGTVLEHEMTVQEALGAAHLAGWNVRKLDLFGRETVISEDGVTTSEVVAPAWRLVVRDNPVTGAVEPLGPVGHGFHHVQNEEHAEFLAALLDMTGARFISSAGALRGGRQVFYSAKLPEAMMIGGVDRHDLYVTAMNGHDGSMALSAVASPIRVVCANTQAAAIRSASQRWATRHTKGAANAIADARKVMEMTFRFNEAFEREAERMIQETLALGQFEKIVEGLFPLPLAASVRTQSNYVERRRTLAGLFADADTQRSIAGTRWAGYNALTEYVDHYAPARAKGDAKTTARALSAIDGEGANLKAKAFDAFRVPVGA